MSLPACPRMRAAAVMLVVLAGLVEGGRLANLAWMTRPSPDAVPAAPVEAGAKAPPFLLGIVDGLREEAVADGPDGAMPFWNELSREGASGTALAGEPTMTACCVRTLLTGQNPDLASAFKNFDSDPVEGSIVQFLVERGARAAHAGDAAAWQLAKPWYPAENVLAFADRGPDDRGEHDRAAFPFAKKRAEEGVDLLTVHFVDPDHAGHLHGATGPDYRSACITVDVRLRVIVDAFRGRHPDATILLSADHGVTSRGTHGGGEPAARRAAYVLAGPRVRRGHHDDIPQSSLAPTVAALLGLPAPPLSETPPVFDLTTLSPDERVKAMDAWLSARIAVAKRTDAKDLAEAIDIRRAQVWKERANGQGVDGLATLAAELEEGAFSVRRPGSIALALALAGIWLAVVARAAGTPSGRWNSTAALAGTLAVAGAVALPPAVGALILALSSLALLQTTESARSGTRTLTLAGFAALPVLGGAGLVLQHAFDAAENAGPVGLRTGFAMAFLVGAFAYLLSRPPVRTRLLLAAERHPGLLAAVAGLLLGFTLSLRLFIDPIVHTPILFALAGGAAVLALALSKGARENAPRARWILVGIAAVVFAGSRAAEGMAKSADWYFWGVGQGLLWTIPAALGALALAGDAFRGAKSRSERILLVASLLALLSAALLRTALRGSTAAWWTTFVFGLSSLGAALRVGKGRVRLSVRLLASIALASLLHDRSDAQLLGFVLLAVGARIAAEFAAPRTRLAVGGLAIAVLAIRVATFHSFGFIENRDTIDTGAGIAPGLALLLRAATTFLPGMSVENWVNLSLLLLKFGLTWIVLLSAAGFSFSRDGSKDGLRTLAVDLSIAYASRGASIIAAAWVWWRSSWWARTADHVYEFAVGDAILLVGALLVAGGFAARKATPT